MIFRFSLGSGQVLKTSESNLALNSTLIGPSATLIFDVELLEIK